MKQLHELVDLDEPGWLLVQQWLAKATNAVEVLPPPHDARRERALLDTQVTTRSPMGAVIYESGGILVDHGWLRVLGSGHPRLPRSLPAWNLTRTMIEEEQPPPFLLVADDVVGGFFAIDGGGLGFGRGEVCYFAPDILEWECTEMSYSEFLVWCFEGDLAKYYENVRWPGWQEQVREIQGDEAFGIYPFLWCEGPPIADRMRQTIPIAESYALHFVAS